MIKNLISIKNKIDSQIELISNLGEVDIELIDVDGKKISRTGLFLKSNENKYYNLPHIYKETIKKNKKIKINNIKKENKLDLGLSFLENKFKFLMILPIVVEDQALGALLVVANKESKLENFDLFESISNQTMNFILNKFKSKIDTENFSSMINIFETVVRNMEEGAIVVNDKNEIQIINKSAKIQLGIDRIINNEKLQLMQTGDNISDADEFKIKIGENEATVIGQIFEVKDNLYYKSVFLFKDIQKLQSSIYEMTNTINVVDTDSIIGSSEKTKELKKDIKKVAKSISTVLISGESGTGKEMVATAIWKNSDRRNERFVAINCAAIPESLLESELFGYVKGAFTGADPKGRMGKFELANKGVIFLDEIGDMPLYLQSKLLRVIQEKKVSRIGSNQIIPLDVRIIAASNQNLRQMIKNNQFREDLYYRLNVIPMEISPLRERTQDIKDLILYYIDYYGRLFSKNFNCITDKALENLYNYSWPGNVRELENAVEYMVNMMENGVINEKILPKNIYNPFSVSNSFDEIRPLFDLEKEEIEKALKIYGNDTEGKKNAAKALGIGIATLYRKIQNYENGKQ